jgi:mRNA interferase RelE/StbE
MRVDIDFRGETMWDVRLLPRAERDLKKLDRAAARSIRDKLVWLATLESPEASCKALHGPLVGLWRYRVGDYRIVLDIRRADLVIVAVDLGHRSTIY